MKTSHDELYALCEAHDIVILQETWLAKNELSLLSKTHCDFIGNGVSSIDDELKINSGRPHGGIGIMWRKNMNKHCTFKTYPLNNLNENGTGTVPVFCQFYRLEAPIRSLK